MIAAFHQKYGKEFQIEMVTLSQLYSLIKDETADANLYNRFLAESGEGND